MSSSAKRILATAAQTKNLPLDIAQNLQHVIAAKEQISRKLQDLQNQKIKAVTSRIHGDFHLGEILFTGKDFAIVDYEGTPEKSLSEKRLKRSPLFDVATLINSLYTAAYTPILEQKDSLSPEDTLLLETWLAQWHSYYANIFFTEYRDTVQKSNIIPENETSLRVLLEALFLTRALQQLDLKLRNPTESLFIPLKRIQQLLS
jgi:maltose alpha-D-glucosyltransferase/alpha-amylase